MAESASNVQPAAAREPASWTVVVSVLNRLLSRTRDVVAASATGGPEYRAAAAVPVEETVPCDSGSMVLSGSLDDQTGRGTLTVTFDACMTDGETWNGTGTFRVDAMDLTYFEITDGLLSFQLLAITGPALDLSMSFDVRLQLFINENRERLTLNLVGQDNNSGDMVKYENCVEENVYIPSVLFPMSYTQTLQGRLYDSEYGYIDFVTVGDVPLTYGVMEQDYPDSGVMLYTGASSVIRMETRSATRVALYLDSDGDEVFETEVTLLWSEIGEPVAADIGDNDGDTMHNSWETIYGLNPDDPSDALLDPDADGVSNYQEYLDRTDPTTGFLEVPFVEGFANFGYFEPYRGQTFKFSRAVTAQSLTVYVGGASDPMEFRVLVVEIDMTAPGTGGVVYPTNVLFESGTMTVLPSSTLELKPFTVNLGGISLDANKTYAWLLDAFATNVPEQVSAWTGADSSGSYPDGFMIWITRDPSYDAREDYFAGGFGSNVKDMAFKLEYKFE